MADILQFKKPRQTHLRGAARQSYSDALKSVGKPRAVIIVALGMDGSFATRVVYDAEKMEEFDVYARGEALLGDHKRGCFDAD